MNAPRPRAARFTFEPYFPHHGGPRRFVGMWRPPWDEAFPLLVQNMISWVPAEVQQRYLLGETDRPLYALEGDEP